MKPLLNAVVLLSLFVPSAIRAQSVKLNSTHLLRPQLSIGSLSVTASPSVINLVLVPGGRSTASPTITINNLISLSTLGTFTLYASFASASALTNTSGDIIPASAIFGKCTGSASYLPFTQLGPLGSSSSLLIYQTSSLATLLLNQTQTCTLMIDLTSLPQLPAGAYSSTLMIQAQAF